MAQTTKLELPFTGQWLTFWGGNTAKQNHHHDSTLQQYAFDFIQVNEEGGFYATDGKTNEDYYSFGWPILAPADGLVVEVVDGVRDNLPGVINPYSITGNHVLIQHNSGEFSLLAHLRNGSTIVKAGTRISSGQKIGECGNSGNSSDPHLHYHLQNSATFARLTNKYVKKDVAKGVEVWFSNITVERDNKAKVYNQYSPIKGDKVKKS